MQPTLNIAVKAARRAGDTIIRALEQGRDVKAEAKGRNDFVTEVDRQAEALILDTLLKAYPKHGILAEESGIHRGDGEHEWIIDPLDGTTNFMHGYLHFAVSIALRRKGMLECGVIYDPVHQELYTAARGEGAFLNNRRIRVSQTRSLEGSLLGTGFPFRGEQYVETYLASFRHLFIHAAGVRRAGSAALDLAHTAAGRFDGFWEFTLKPWDMAAGALLILEAGGMVGEIGGGDAYLESGNIVAGTPRVFTQLAQLLREHLPKTSLS